jgi:uncharacterized protein
MVGNPVLRVDNLTRGINLIDRGAVANTVWTRLQGLMGVRRLREGTGLMITPCNQIHTHFMLAPIDVLYVDADNRVVDIDSEMRAWRIGRLRKGARYVIELPSGTVARTGSAIGDQLQVVFSSESSLL